MHNHNRNHTHNHNNHPCAVKEEYEPQTASSHIYSHFGSVIGVWILDVQ